MPYETTRVCLQPIRGVEGSDYINASFIDGYRYSPLSIPLKLLLLCLEGTLHIYHVLLFVGNNGPT